MCCIIKYLSKICQNVELILSNYKWFCIISVFDAIDKTLNEKINDNCAT